MLETDNYYYHDQLHREQYNYGQTGGLTSIYLYENGNVMHVAEFDANNKNMTVEKKDGFKKIFETQFANGKTKVHYEITCGRYSGPLIHYLPNGKEFYAMDWRNGTRQGMYRNMTIDNTVQWGGNWVDGGKTGWWEERNSVDQVEARGKMVNNNYDSIWTYYYINGAVSSRADYQDDEREGITEFYLTDGTHILSKRYEGGMLIAYKILINGKWGEWQPFTADVTLKASLANGVLVYEETYKSGLQEGKKRIFYPSGKLYSEFDFKKGDYEGAYTIYHANGKLAETGTYLHDELNGIKKYFAEDGTVIIEEEFLLGVPHGRFASYKAGKLMNEVKFLSGEPVY
jgi:uncharacterized protein